MCRPSGPSAFSNPSKRSSNCWRPRTSAASSPAASARRTAFASALSAVVVAPGITAAMRRPLVHIVTPALAEANNGNWQTARRWARMLAQDYRVHLGDRWEAGPTDPAVALIALHARRSAVSIADWERL